MFAETAANLLQGLKSPDSAEQEKAIAETEKRLREQGAGREEEEEKEEECRTTVNRTLINPSEQGNEAFRAGDFALAIQRYSEGLEKLRDKQELYTNRAQAYLKLHEYEKAISDCEWALKCNKNCLKAYFLMGKAHLALQHFSECRQCYEKMLQIDPQKENLFKECVEEARLEEQRLREEQRAQRELQAGSVAALSIQQLLQSISSPGHDLPYYTGAISLLAGAVTTCSGQTFFRTNNGFSILSSEAVRGFQAQCRATFSTAAGCPDASPGYQSCVFALLGLMMNLLLECNGTILDFAVPISGRCLALLSHQDGRIVTRATGVLSRVLPASPSAVQEVVRAGVVKKMLKFLKAGGQLTSSYAIKTLSVCTKSSRRAQEELLKGDKRFQVLLGLLHSPDELTVGNAAFCLSQCLLLPGAASSLLGSGVVQLLLRHAGGDAARSSVQQNSAIALGRLCVAEPRHMQQLRKLNGLAILNSCMKYVQSS
ncbi:hypothetical protein EK904_006861 [Melospiza melodia maxima]|nr:hypothetical protein EK904_006861 [Melospiza melodia maxima]